MREIEPTRYVALGPLSVYQGSKELDVTRRASRVVLGCLLLELGKYVRLDTIIDVLYESDPPKSATNQVHRGVCQLRKLTIPIETKHQAYRLDVPRESVDCHRFADLCDEAESEAAVGPERMARAAELYARAVSLWRGPALSDLDRPSFELPRKFWNERLVVAREARIEAELALGRHREVIPDLIVLRDNHPFRECFVRQLMLALYRSGRASEALEVYRGLETELSESLGTDPDPSLMNLRVRILRQDPDLQCHNG